MLAHRFWEFDGLDRVLQMAMFFGDMAIVAGLAIAAVFANGRKEAR